MSWETYAAYVAIVAVFFATPPDTSQLLVMSNSLRHGLRRTLWTVGGDLSANVLQMIAAAFGLASAIALSADALWWIKWGGVAYLAWLGLSLLLAPGGAASAPRPAEASPLRLFRQGFLTSSANPYAVVFFGALFPQFIDPALPVWPQLLILGVTYLIVDGATLIAWGWAASRTMGRAKRLSGALVARISGALMIAAAALLASRDLSEMRGDTR